MSEDTDERMDRAKRIRQLREGRRAGTAPTDADDEPGDGGDDTGGENASSGGDAGEGAGDGPTDDGSPAETGQDDADQGAGSAGGGGDRESAASDDRPAARNGDAAGAPGSTADGPGEAGSVPDSEHPDPSPNNGSGAGTGDESVPAADGDATADGPVAAARRAARAAEAVTATETDRAEPAPEGVASVASAGSAQANVGNAATGTGGFALPDQDVIEAALERDRAESSAGSRGASARATEGTQTAQTEESVRVLEFTLGDERYCLDITYVEEIVKRESVTRVPNTPEYVDGVVDLRGQITTILDPRRLLDVETAGSGSHLVVFDPDEFDGEGWIGWIVDEVRQVVPITESDVNDPPVDQPAVEGVVDREDDEEFVIWTDPQVAVQFADEDGDGEVD